MFWNYLAICAGIFICFAAWHFKTIASSITGFTWGVLIGVIVALATTESFFDLDEKIRMSLWIFGILGGGVCFLCNKEENVAAIEGALGTFAVYTFLVGYDDEGKLISTIFVALILAAVAAYVCFKYSIYAHILVSAITGALLFNIGRIGVSEEIELSEVMLAIMMFGFERELSSIIWGALALTIIGSIFQVYRMTLSDGNADSNINYSAYSGGKTSNNNYNYLQNDNPTAKDKEIEELRNALSEMKKQLNELAKPDNATDQSSKDITALEEGPETGDQADDSEEKTQEEKLNELSVRLYGVPISKKEDILIKNETSSEDDTYIVPKFCENCGGKLKPNYKVCPNCGKRISLINKYDIRSEL